MPYSNSAGIVLSSAYVAPGLASEFGFLPPSFLPLANRRLYCWQLEKLKDYVQTLFLTIPQGFPLEEFDREWLLQNRVSVCPRDENRALGATVSKCLSLLDPSITDVLLLFGDTYLSNPGVMKENSVAVGHTQEHSRWGYCRQGENGQLEFFEDYNMGDGGRQPVVVGCFRLKRDTLQKCLDLSGKDFYAALNLYAGRQGLSLIDVGNDWYDFGHINSYFRSRQHFTTERTFNSIKIEKRKVSKFSKQNKKMKAGTLWYESVPRDIDVYLPGYLGRTRQAEVEGYATEYLFLPPLNDLFVYGRLPETIWQQIFDGCREFLEECRNYPGTDDILEDCWWLYGTKTEERLSEFCRLRDISPDQPWRFNGKQLPSLQEIYESVLKLISAPSRNTTSIIHGDFHFANIFFDFRSLGVKLVDPRGMIRGIPTIYGDNRYDLAKLAHSVDGLYDFILAGILKADMKAPYEIEFTVKKNRQIDIVQSLFASMQVAGTPARTREIRAIMVLLFLSMLPLHNDVRTRQDTLLANMFRLYAELEQE